MKPFLVFLIAIVCAFGSGEKRATMRVTAYIRPNARIEVQSRTSLIIGVTMYPNVESLLWTATGSCGAPDHPKIISNSGIHHVSFDLEELVGKDLVCLISSDGTLKTSARLPE